MSITGPETRWQKFKRTPAIFDIGSAIITAGGLFATAARFFYTQSPGWGWLTVVLGVLVLVIQGLKARATYREQVRKDSVHELRGCLHTLETVLLGEDLEPAKRAAAGLRLTIHRPVGNDLEQVMEYVGDQRKTGCAGRRIPKNVGVAGQAIRQAELDQSNGGITGPKLFHGSRENNDYDAFLRLMVDEHGFTLDAARRLDRDTMSWLGFAIMGDGKLHGVLYCDSKQANFFTERRREDVLHATVGIAYFVGLRYS